VRRRPAAGAATRIPGGTPSAWRKDLGAEIACELAVSTHAAETLAGLAVVLETRLPLTAAALDAGILHQDHQGIPHLKNFAGSIDGKRGCPWHR